MSDAVMDLIDLIITPTRPSSSLRPATRTRLVRSDGSPCRWPEIRAHVLREADYTCVLCAEPANEVDHIWPKRWGGDDVVENLQALCGPCNKAKGVSLDWPRATQYQVLHTFAVAHQRFIEDMNGVCRDALSEVRQRCAYEDLTHEEVRAQLDSVVEGLQDALEAVTEWAMSFPIARDRG